jgi:hypothetical protein
MEKQCSVLIQSKDAPGVAADIRYVHTRPLAQGTPPHRRGTRCHARCLEGNTAVMPEPSPQPPVPYAAM